MDAEQRQAHTQFRAILPSRTRITLDVEGWPMARGRYGQLEWHDASTLAIFSSTPRMLAKLAQIPGVRRHQRGDQEFRLLLPVEKMHEKGILGALCRLRKVRTHRILSERQKEALFQGRRPFRATS